MQKRHPIAFESQTLQDIKKLYSIYNKEMWSIMYVFAKSKQYFVGNKFVVKTNHNNLRHFLEQRDLNERQQKWVSNIQAYDFDIEYVRERRIHFPGKQQHVPSQSLLKIGKLTSQWSMPRTSLFAQLLTKSSKTTGTNQLTVLFIIRTEHTWFLRQCSRRRF